jgi:hypothetical protein
LAKVRCGCTKCEFNNNSECQSDDLDFRSEREDRGSGITCGTFRRKR